MIDRNILKRVIIEQNEFKGKFIKREKYNTLLDKAQSKFAIIISGIRRCGKSVLLNHFRLNQKEKNYFLNFDDERLHNFSIEDFEKLYETFIELYSEENTFYFDEIQNIVGWEKFVRRIIDAGNKVYITGSNASMLSKELGTRLTGRYIPIELYPASFKEFLDFNNIKINKADVHKREKIVIIKKHFKTYVQKGGFLEYLKSNDKDFFKILYDNILYRDIVARYKISHERGIKDIFYYLISNISKQFSYTSLKTISNISGVSTIKEYISYLENSYLLFTINNFDFSLKKQLVNPKKVYAIDTGLANSISFKFSENYGRILENIVFLELKRRSKEIYYHQNKYECDFIIRQGADIIEAIQVSQSLIESETKSRKIQGLIESLQKFKLKEGLILTESEEDELVQDGFKVIVKPIWKWLIGY